MALVAYDYGSNSENEDEEGPTTSSVTIQNELKQDIECNSVKEKDTIVEQTIIENKHLTEGSIFSVLPESKGLLTDVMIEEQIEDFIPKPKKEKQKVKISIPSLAQFADLDEEPQSKKIKPSTKGSGLISLLPPVKGAVKVKTATTFIPKVIADKSKNSNTKPVPTSKNVVVKKAALLQKGKQNRQVVLSDAESDDDIEMPETFDDEMWEKVCGRPKHKPVIHEIEPLPQEPVNIAPEPEKPYDGLDNRAFKELVGKSRRPIGNIKLIDINEEEILLEKDIWMAKSLTDPEMAPRPVIEDPVDPTRRKKHHITYLAQQAKANEQDLKNQWAANKNNKLATKSKYGF